MDFTRFLLLYSLLIQWFSNDPIFSPKVPFLDWNSTIHCEMNGPFWFHVLFIVSFLWEEPINWVKLSSGCGFFCVDPCPKGDELNCSAHFSCDLRWTETHLKNEAQVLVQESCECHAADSVPASWLLWTLGCSVWVERAVGGFFAKWHPFDLEQRWSFHMYNLSFLIFICFRCESYENRFMCTNFY